MCAIARFLRLLVLSHYCWIRREGGHRCISLTEIMSLFYFFNVYFILFLLFMVFCEQFCWSWEALWVPRSRAHDRWWSSGMCAPRAAVSGEREGAREKGSSLALSLCLARTHINNIRRVDRRVSRCALHCAWPLVLIETYNKHNMHHYVYMYFGWTRSGTLMFCNIFTT